MYLCMCLPGLGQTVLLPTVTEEAFVVRRVREREKGRLSLASGEYPVGRHHNKHRVRRDNGVLTPLIR